MGMLSLCQMSCGLLSGADNRVQVNTFPLESKVDSLAELSDGVVFCAMLGAYRPGIPFGPPSHAAGY